MLLGVGTRPAAKVKKPYDVEVKATTAMQDRVSLEQAAPAAPWQQPEQAQAPLNEFKEGEHLERQVISSGGTYATAGSYRLEGTVSQTATDKGSFRKYDINFGTRMARPRAFVIAGN